VNGTVKRSPSNIGCQSEHLAIAWLLKGGYEVFKNVCAVGPVDIVAMDRNGAMAKIDVKTATSQDERAPHPRRSVEPKQQALGVRVVLVYGDGSCKWADTNARRPADWLGGIFTVVSRNRESVL
jgi:Holliday junction resolvase-like predicted endonuclease